MIEQYVSTRLAPQMEYYKKQCKKLKREFYVLSIIVIVANAIVPILTLALELHVIVKFVIATLSAVSTAISSISLLRKPKEKWVTYRWTYERLKREKFLFEARAGLYKNGCEADFVENCESIIDAEYTLWKTSNTAELDD